MDKRSLSVFLPCQLPQFQVYSLTGTLSPQGVHQVRKRIFGHRRRSVFHPSGGFLKRSNQKSQMGTRRRRPQN